MIDKVFVDGVHIPECVAYDQEAGWARGRRNGLWLDKVYGEVRVTIVGIQNAPGIQHKAPL